MINTKFTVYGTNAEEIEERAKMIARRFFGERKPCLRYEAEKIEIHSGGGEFVNLWKAEVHASWNHPLPPLPEGYVQPW